MPTTPVKKAPARKAPAKKVVAKADAPAATAVGAVRRLRAMYPKDAELFVHTTESGVTIAFPKFSTIPRPERALFRRLYNLDGGLMFQAFEWMNYANVPESVQVLTDPLSDQEFQDLFDAWFADSDLTQGE